MNPQVQFQDEAVSIQVEDDINEYNSDSPVANRDIGVFGYADQLNVEKIDEGSNEFEILGNSLAAGMKVYGKNVEVVGAYKKRYDWSVIDEARLAVFRVFAAAVARRNGGDANIRYGWYGGSRDEIQEIMKHGFRRFENSGSEYGRGVHLSPPNCPMQSVKRSVADSDGLMYLLLCRVILGRPEVIGFGSQKDRPSSTRFDSGVNDISSPTTYVIWEHHMNTHVLPVYAVSFRIDSLTGTSSLTTPKASRMGINGLMSRLTNYLGSSKMVMIKKLHHAYHKNKISRTAFIRSLRAAAGDEVLRNIVQSLMKK